MDLDIKDPVKDFARTKTDEMKKSFAVIFFIMLTMVMRAQGGKWTELMNGTGKVFVVIAVMLTILAGLVLYLVRLDRKISKLEKNK